MVREFHPKAVVLSLHFVLFFSLIIIQALVIPIISVFIPVNEIALLAGPITLALGFIFSELLEGKIC